MSHDVASLISGSYHTCLKKFPLQLFSSGVVEFLAFDEALGHALEVLLRDRPVLVEVDALEVRLHLANPEVGHGCCDPALRHADKTMNVATDTCKQMCTHWTSAGAMVLPAAAAVVAASGTASTSRKFVSPKQQSCKCKLVMLFGPGRRVPKSYCSCSYFCSWNHFFDTMVTCKTRKVAFDGSVECHAPPPRWCDLELWPFDPKMQSVHLCPEMHQWQKFGENPSTDTGDIAET